MPSASTISHTNHFTREPRLERWLQKLVHTYQDASIRPRRRFNNLTRLGKPSQLYAVSLRGARGNLTIILVTHLEHVANAETKAFVFGSVAELADFATVADRILGTEGVRLLVSKLDDWIYPVVGPAASACQTLADWQRRELRTQGPRIQGAEPQGQMIYQSEPPASFWNVVHAGRLPDARSFLIRISEKRRSRGNEREPIEPEPTAFPHAEPPKIFGAFSEPVIWFGEPPFPSIEDRILSPDFFHLPYNRWIAAAAVGGVPTYVYNSGLVVAGSSDRPRARSIINQVFAAFSRSGVDLYAVSDAELVTISKFNPWTAEIGGSSSLVVHRNRLMSPRFGSGPSDFSYGLPEEVVMPVLECANNCMQDTHLQTLALRLFDAVTLLERDWFTEAFVVSWSLIELALQLEFEKYWLANGRSRTYIREMENDWTASHRIDLLRAAGVLGEDRANELHALRKSRNRIVHQLREATRADTDKCLRVAADLNPIPAVAMIPKPKYVSL